MAETILIKNLRLAEYNPREMSKADFESLKKSIQEFGLIKGMVVNTYKGRENIVVGGNMTVRALIELGWKEIPKDKIDFVSLPEPKEKLLNLALNRIKGTWDETMLAELISNLNKIDAKLDLSGFNEVELSNLLDQQMLRTLKESEFSVEEELEKVEKPKTKYGEIYKLGRHKLMCGDATKEEDVKKLMGNEKADMVFTDPPYNVGYESTELAGKFPHKGKILGDFQKEEQFAEFIEKSFTNLNWALKTGGTIYICSGYSSYPLFYYQMLNTGFEFSHCIIWLKSGTIVSWADYKCQYEQLLKGVKRKYRIGLLMAQAKPKHSISVQSKIEKKYPKTKIVKPYQTGKSRDKAEPILYGWKPGQKHQFYGGQNEADVWEMPRKGTIKMLHATEKPEWLIMKAIKLSSRVGQLVLDLFGGSGSTLTAAEKLERRANIMELDPIYCDVIIKRFETITGQKAQKLTK